MGAACYFSQKSTNCILANKPIYNKGFDIKLIGTIADYANAGNLPGTLIAD